MLKEEVIELAKTLLKFTLTKKNVINFMKNTNKPTKSEIIRVLDFLMESQNDNTTAIFIDKNTIDIDYGIFPENVSIECKNGADFCDLLEKHKDFKFEDESKIKS